jgi:hypothetical protein
VCKRNGRVVPARKQFLVNIELDMGGTIQLLQMLKCMELLEEKEGGRRRVRNTFRKRTEINTKWNEVSIQR